tara:strand:- start:516 stop:923 length:408 start_codon:yes stop_codon:yes gene_type:complete
MAKNIILLRGVSGSGKSTVAKLIGIGMRTVSTDDFFTNKEGDYEFNPNNLKENHKKCQLAVEMMMEEYDHVDNDIIIVHNTFTEIWEMDTYYILAKKYGYTVHTLIVENRHKSKSIHNIPEETIEAQSKRFHVSL